MNAPRHHTTRLDALLDRELEPAGERDAVGHVADCTACRKIMDTNALLGELLDQPLPEVPPAFVQATTRRAFAAHRPSAPLWWISLPVSWRVSFAALLLLATLAGFRAGRAAPSGTRIAQELASLLDSPEVAAMEVPPASPMEVPR